MPDADDTPYVDTEAVIRSADALRRTFGSAGWSAPSAPDVANAAATVAIGDAANAIHGLAGVVATQLDAAALTITTAAIETRTVDVAQFGAGDDDGEGWVSWPG